ncbi:MULTISPECIES: hypothetical protein [Enterococcus]|uniref:Uncharacterized protein n=1 Tax=Enterococcus raffinosus TaxID=71452 RepID=A0AAW8TCG0_9ENTE|nr:MULTISPECIES: hypothetical protein [Enterococcus]MBX9038920.1 hypothetical protein [Enterococcus raffinosus]MDT2524971.1 hypothetical protein [Enterococcus raffinosus]MDT2531301.1 hypothetical protein [Enterococcus raffinosus]MDT2535688.1 hypothetical protein [Enterococcus raffinosus]MDT2545982.1 hypothetical protein [Enterococcus raffinosus]
MVYFLLLIFGLGLLVHSYLFVTVMKQQRELKDMLNKRSRRKPAARPMPTSYEKRGRR